MFFLRIFIVIQGNNIFEIKRYRELKNKPLEKRALFGNMRKKEAVINKVEKK